MHDLVRSFRAVDWHRTDEVGEVSGTVLAKLVSEPDLLRKELLSIPDRPELAVLCEHYDILDKLVLYSDEKLGVRVRLHVFLPGYFDRPHNHRWTYTTRVLKGGYDHVLYGTDEQLDDTVDGRALQPLMVRHEPAGSTYTLHHSMIHAVRAQPFTTTLVVRGPAVKDRFVVTDRTTGKSWWQYGAKSEDPAIAAAKRMAPNHLKSIISKLIDENML